MERSYIVIESVQMFVCNKMYCSNGNINMTAPHNKHYLVDHVK